MAFDIKMPQLSDTMDSGKILEWKKNEGDSIKRGDILAEVETDKANLEIESFNEGVLLKVIVPAQASADVGQIIAVIGQPGEEVSISSNPPSNGASTPATPTATPQASNAQPAPTISSPSSTRIKASPLARKLAEQQNVDLGSLQGSGPAGRIIKQDVERAGSGASTSPASSPVVQSSSSQQQPAQSTPTIPSSAPAAGQLQALSKMRETIARRMQESVREAPHFYTTVSINMQEVLRLRAIMKTRDEYKGVSVNHFIIKAAAYGLANEPRVNCAMRDGQLYNPGQINIGVITAIEDGLLIPVIRDANQLSLQDVAFEARAAVERARAGRPNSSDLTGGTFSISNMGMFDVESFTAIINPGQGAVLAVSSVKEEPIVRDGQVTVGSMMKVTLSVDHRIIDGIMSANFLKFFKQGLEAPALLMI